MFAIASQIVIGSLVWLFVFERTLALNQGANQYSRRMRIGGIFTCGLFFGCIILLIALLAHAINQYSSWWFSRWVYETLTWPYALSDQLSAFKDWVLHVSQEWPITSLYVLVSIALITWQMMRTDSENFERWRQGAWLLLLLVATYLSTFFVGYFFFSFLPESFRQILEHLDQATSLKPTSC